MLGALVGDIVAAARAHVVRRWDEARDIAHQTRAQADELGARP